ncbi:MAG: amidohydrolase family protein, partial [Deltaproteobacteria bacterium]|nr:amidohydrolase family protein [Deltaproteobacteria bacterium]
MGKQIYLKNGFVISMNPSRDVYESGDILIEDDKLLSVGQVDQGAVLPDAEVVDLKGQIVMPGIINSHVHLSQQLGRGLGDDVNLLTWLHERIWPYESNLTEADSYISSLACMVEQIRCGVTSIAEPGGQHVSGMAKAAAECGIRAALAQSAMDCGEGLPDKWQLSTQEMLDIQEENIKQ